MEFCQTSAVAHFQNFPVHICDKHDICLFALLLRAAHFAIYGKNRVLAKSDTAPHRFDTKLRQQRDYHGNVHRRHNFPFGNVGRTSCQQRDCIGNFVPTEKMAQLCHFGRFVPCRRRVGSGVLLPVSRRRFGVKLTPYGVERYLIKKQIWKNQSNNL